jgi:hypothetical protein
VDPAEGGTRFLELASSPNPFQESTSFRFSLPSEAVVELGVYDVEGRRVARLADGVRAAGTHEVRWDASGLPSGTYFARFSTEDLTTTHRVLLVR